jgi:regulation of enolase protein 1 (concanavalin A-like superfamily)
MKYRVILLAVIFFLPALTSAQPGTKDFALPGIPATLSWVNAPSAFSVTSGQLHITASGKTDLFIDPQDAYAIANSPKAVFQAPSIFRLSARVELNFKSDYDAGVLVLYGGKTEWAKLCFEFSPQKKPFVVSVVNRSISDDCNHVPIPGNRVYLRISGLGKDIYAFHYSTDGHYWNLVRYFYLPKNQEPMRVGFSSQSPTGAGCASSFSEIAYSTQKLNDVRNGE